MSESQRAQINPLYDPIWVFCNMQDMDQIGITELGWFIFSSTRELIFPFHVISIIIINNMNQIY